MQILLAVDAPSSHLFPLPNGWADRGHAVDVVMDRPDGRFGHAREHVHPGVRLLNLSHNGSVLDAVTGEPTAACLAELLNPADAVVIGGYATRVARSIVGLRRHNDARVILLAERPRPRTLGPKRWLRDAWARWFISRVDAIWSMSEAGDRAFTKLGRTPEARIPYPLIAPPQAEGSAISSAEKWSFEAERRILVLGKLIERKQPLQAIEAVRILHGRGMELRASLAGTGPLEDKIRHASKGLPVSLLGRVSKADVEELLAISHLVLHPAVHDGWGMAVVEAACRGTPVVATAGCDAATELAARTSGVRIVDGSPAGLSDAVEELIEEFKADPVNRSLELRCAVEEVCGGDRIVERSLDVLTSGGTHRG